MINSDQLIRQFRLKKETSYYPISMSAATGENEKPDKSAKLEVVKVDELSEENNPKLEVSNNDTSVSTIDVAILECIML